MTVSVPFMPAAAWPLTVLVDGRVLVSGAPEEIRRSPAVRDAYLGGEGA